MFDNTISQQFIHYHNYQKGIPMNTLKVGCMSINITITMIL